MIEIINRQRKRRLNQKKIKSLIERLAARYRLRDAEISVVFVGIQAIRTLNRKFRKKDRPTDVLSFSGAGKCADGRRYLGDIVISVPVAERQARERGHGLDREIEILTLHGFLHLAGFDHGRDISSEEERLRKIIFGARA